MLDPEEVPHVDSLPAQLASLYVENEYSDRWAAFDDALFEALWQEGRNISDAEGLAAIAEGIGVDGEAIRGAIADDGLRDRLFESFAEARERGITDVPTLVYDGRTSHEVLSVEELERFLREE